MWNKVKLGEVLCRVKDDITIEDNTSYKQITVRLNHKGVILRGLKNGIEIKSKQFIAKTGNLIISGIDARNGAVGIVPEELNGAVVTNDFLLYDCNNLKLSTEYIAELLKTEYFDNELKKASEGTTNRVRLQKDKFLKIEIPLPPLSEQLTIVAKLENATAKLKQIKQLRAESLKETEILKSGYMKKAFELKKDWKEKIISDICYHPQYGFTASANFELGNVKMLRITDIQEGKVNWDKVPFCMCQNSETYLLQENDILFARTGGTIGKSFLIKGNVPESVFASYLIRLRIKDDTNIDYVYNFFQSPEYWQQVFDTKTGTGQPNINGQKLAKLKIPIPPLEIQNQIVNEIENFNKKLDTIKQLQQQTEAEITAMEKSILNKYIQTN